MEVNASSGRLLNVFVVDDEPGDLAVLAADLRALPEVGEVRSFSSYADAALPLLEVQPDVLFLDVEVPGKSGLEFLESVQRGVTFSFRVVFYSAHSRYMLQALRSAAFDFLLKPYKTAELRSVVARIASGVASESAMEGKFTLDTQARRKIAIQTVCELLLLTVEEVLFLQYGKSTRAWSVTLTNGMTHRLHQGTKAENLLALHPSLARINSGCIVNVAYLSAVENATLRCRFCPPYDHLEVYASRRYFSRLKEKFELL